MNTCETCRYYMASPLQEPCESCRWDGVIGHDPPNWKGPTKGDRIRSMTDEELAEWASAITLDEFGDKKYWLDWLKQEVESNDS